MDEENLPIREYWVFTPRIPKFLEERGIKFIGWKKRSDAMGFAKLEAKKLRKKIEVKLAYCPYPEDEFDFDNWKRCVVKPYAVIYPDGRVERKEKKVIRKKKKK